VESRPLRYFVAVAEELNFTRAAERLGISSPPLSRAIRRLEADLDVALFERTTHSVALTPAGAVLLEEARIALDALQAAERRTRRAAGPEPKLVLAVKADGGAALLDAILARYSTDPAARPVAIHLCEWGEQPQLLRQGEADAALVHEPFDRTGLDAETVTVEPRVAAIPAAHPLAARDDLRLAISASPTASCAATSTREPPRGPGCTASPRCSRSSSSASSSSCCPSRSASGTRAPASPTAPSRTRHPLYWRSHGPSSPARRPPRPWYGPRRPSRTAAGRP
jgi:DNA-binding transcriptional LysR family regulator